jgi:hypothetical protein
MERRLHLLGFVPKPERRHGQLRIQPDGVPTPQEGHRPPQGRGSRQAPETAPGSRQRATAQPHLYREHEPSTTGSPGDKARRTRRPGLPECSSTGHAIQRMVWPMPVEITHSRAALALIGATKGTRLQAYELLSMLTGSRPRLVLRATAAAPVTAPVRNVVEGLSNALR